MPDIPTNPLPCGCGAKGRQDLENAHDTGHSLIVGWKDIHVVHCPLHKAAPDLLAALKFVQPGLLQMGSDWSDEANRIVAEAMARAEGK